jgi:hypothetical protein
MVLLIYNISIIKYVTDVTHRASGRWLGTPTGPYDTATLGIKHFIPEPMTLAILKTTVA